MSTIDLGYHDLAIGALLLLADGVLSLVFRLGLVKQLTIAAARMVVQLALVGLVLTQLFTIASPFWTALIALAMMLFAGREAIGRLKARLSFPWAYTIGTGSILLSCTTVLVLALTTQLRPEPWFDPRYAIPLLGMIAGNTMTAISLGIETIGRAAMREKAAIEARLALGHGVGEALSSLRREAIRTGMTPVINAMSATGLVSLPGMMTGQILAGADPVVAVEYQLMVMFLIAGATGLGLTLAVLMTASRLTDGRARLRLDRLSTDSD